VTERIELQLDGDPGQIGAAALRDSLTNVLRLLDAAARALEVEPPRWRVERLHLDSVHAGLEAPNALGIAPLLWHGLDDLRQRVALPAGWSQDMLRQIRNLGRLAGVDGAQAVALVDPRTTHRQVLDAVVTDHAERALEVSEVSWGSLTGAIRRWNGARRIIGLVSEDYPATHAIDVRYPVNLEPEVLAAAAGQDVVEIWGQVERNLAGQVVSANLLELIVRPPSEPMSIREIAGLFGGDPDVYPQTVAQWIEEQRGDD